MKDNKRQENYKSELDKLLMCIYLDGCYKKRKFICDIFSDINNHYDALKYHSFMSKFESVKQSIVAYMLFNESLSYFPGLNNDVNITRKLQIAYGILIGKFPKDFLEGDYEIRELLYFLIMELIFFKVLRKLGVKYKEIFNEKDEQDYIYRNFLPLEPDLEIINKNNIDHDFVNKIILNQDFKDSFTTLVAYTFNYNDNLTKINELWDISSKYNLFFSDLLSPLEKITINEVINSDNFVIEKEILVTNFTQDTTPQTDENNSTTLSYPNDYKIFPLFPTQENIKNFFDYDIIEESNLTCTRFISAINKLILNKELTRIEKGVVIKTIRNSSFYSQIKRSYSRRLQGLWIWDKFYNPLLTTNTSLASILNDLYKLDFYKSSSIDNFKRIMLKKVNNTRECISKGRICPFKK